jgi:hypothetical protein
MTTTIVDQTRPPGTCAATTKAGQPCRGTARTDGAWCFAHDPDLEERRTEARVRGGQNRSTIVRATGRIPIELADVRRRLAAALDAVLAGELDPGVARAAASLSGALVRIHEVAALERLGELERALTDLTEARSPASPTSWRQPA